MDTASTNRGRTPVRVSLGDPRYPERVKVIMGAKAPKHLDMIGNMSLLESPGIGFCGSRKASATGLDMAKDCVKQSISNGVLTISGNAAGVDLAVHLSTLEFGGETILVLPEGMNHFKVKKLLKPVWDWDRVLVISQFEADEQWQIFRAMARNQLIVALSRVVIVIEAGEKGGTLNAGKGTLKSGLPLFVAEYQEMPADAKGNDLLIKMGAQRLGRSVATNRTNLVHVFEKMKEDSAFKRVSLPRDLLQLMGFG